MNCALPLVNKVKFFRIFLIDVLLSCDLSKAIGEFFLCPEYINYCPKFYQRPINSGAYIDQLSLNLKVPCGK